MQAATPRTEGIEQESEAEQEQRMPVERPDETKANQRTERPGSEMEELQLMPGGKAHRLQRRAAGRKQRQVGDVAITEQPPAQLGLVLRMGVLPAQHCLHSSA